MQLTKAHTDRMKKRRAAAQARAQGSIREYDLRAAHVKALYGVFYLVAILGVLLSVLPLVWTILGGFKTVQEFVRGVKTVGPDGKNRFVQTFLPQSWSMAGYLDTWTKLKYTRYYLNSLWVVLGSCAAALLSNGLLAYGIAILKPRGYKLAHGMVMGSLLIPGGMSIVPLFININRLGLSGTFIPLWLGVGASAFYVVLFKNFYEAMPSSLIEASRLDGATNLQLYFRVVLPLSMPINMVVLIYTVNGAWSDFLLPYLVLANTKLETVMVQLFKFRDSGTTTFVEIIRAMVFSILPPIALFILFQRQITSNVMAAGLKG